MKALDLNKLGIQDVSSSDMEYINGGLKYVWDDNDVTLRTPIYNGIVAVTKVWEWMFN